MSGLDPKGLEAAEMAYDLCEPDRFGRRSKRYRLDAAVRAYEAHKASAVPGLRPPAEGGDEVRDISGDLLCVADWLSHGDELAKAYEVYVRRAADLLERMARGVK
jgi:hypothetical protein